jgi:hypothetical protein
MVDTAMHDLVSQEKTKEVACTFSRYGVAYMGVCEQGSVGATENTWNRVLSEGLGTTLNVNWYTTKYSWGYLRVLRLGEPIFEVMRARGLNPEWDGTSAADFTITVVDEAGAKLALAMALHSRLGADSPFSLVAPRLSNLSIQAQLIRIFFSSPLVLRWAWGRCGFNAKHQRTNAEPTKCSPQSRG